MKRIVILDTWVNDSNHGNKIIMEAVERIFRNMFPHDIVYHVPALEYISTGRDLVKTADYIFLGGTNILSSNMNRTSEVVYLNCCKFEPSILTHYHIRPR